LKQIDQLSAERKLLNEELTQKAIQLSEAVTTVQRLREPTTRSSYVAAVVDVYQHGYERGQEVAEERIASDMLFPRVLNNWKKKLK
jgi:hypothetical protein